MKGYSLFPKSQHCSVSYSGNSSRLGSCRESLTPLQKCSRCVLQPQPTGFLLGKSYPSTKMQSLYSAASADWALGGKVLPYLSKEMQSVYSTAPPLAGWTRTHIWVRDQAHIALSEPMSSTDKQGSSLDSFPTFPPLYPHFNWPSGFWPCLKSCLVGGSDKYTAGPEPNWVTSCSRRKGLLNTNLETLFSCQSPN